ncbi:DNA-binding protein D-ETS-4 [Eumeta japonica]|uniref:DNA-binding protein D-ETS-4 n=1 Tax=Eumeta variegata TaxID=151549 RepID=A0A4C1SYM1_EUMVA|nr:DNA-binding protein D-ETS-4 [Eumeta japonica]
MPQTVPRSGCSPPTAGRDERAVPASPADLQHLLRLLGAASPPGPMPSPRAKPPPPYPDFEGYLTPSPSSEDGATPALAFQPPSPYDSLHYSPTHIIKEEPNRLTIPDFVSYPLSPVSNVSYTSSYNQFPSPSQHEEYIDIEELLKENQILQESVQNSYLTPKVEIEDQPRDHILLRSALEDTSFQKKFNLKPVFLELGEVKMEESSGGAGTSEEALVDPNIDRVLSLAIEQSKRDVDNTCTVLGISPDPMQWSASDVKAWVLFTLQHFQLPPVPGEYFAMDGPALVALTEEEFNQRAPQSGSTLYAQLEIWKAARHEGWRPSAWQEGTPQHSPRPAPAPAPTPAHDDSEENIQWKCDRKFSNAFIKAAHIPRFMKARDRLLRRLKRRSAATSNIHIIKQKRLATRPSNVIHVNTTSGNDSPSSIYDGQSNGITTFTLTKTNKYGFDEDSESAGASSATAGGKAKGGGTHIHLWQFLKELLAAPHIHGSAIRWLDRTTIISDIASALSELSDKDFIVSRAVIAYAERFVLVKGPIRSIIPNRTTPLLSYLCRARVRKSALWCIDIPAPQGERATYFDSCYPVPKRRKGNGVFKIEDSVRVARLWGKRKNRPAMNYDKLSRSIRQYYKKGIMKKTERSQRLVYQFCHPYSL